jgi:SAM-dependent methyltransferase
VPASPATIAAARRGDWQIVLTPNKPVPRDWFGHLAGADVLCLASGGGQQGPVLAAASAHVTVLDNSPRQLAQDRLVAEREGLAIRTIEGDMADLSPFGDATFDLIVHPVSNTFVPDVRPVWAEAYRVLRPGGSLLSGFCNPVMYIFDQEFLDQGELRVKYHLPYSDVTSPSAEERERYLAAGWPLEFGHTLEDQIGGQTDAGFLIAGLYEDTVAESEDDLLSRYTPVFIATRAIKPTE